MAGGKGCGFLNRPVAGTARFLPASASSTDRGRGTEFHRDRRRRRRPQPGLRTCVRGKNRREGNSRVKRGNRRNRWKQPRRGSRRRRRNPPACQGGWSRSPEILPPERFV